MRAADDNAHTLSTEMLYQSFGDLTSQALLHLEPAREAVDETSELGQAYDFAWDVAYVCSAGEGQQMMATKTSKWDISKDYHFIISLIKYPT